MCISMLQLALTVRLCCRHDAFLQARTSRSRVPSLQTVVDLYCYFLKASRAESNFKEFNKDPASIAAARRRRELAYTEFRMAQERFTLAVRGALGAEWKMLWEVSKPRRGPGGGGSSGVRAVAC